jgi:hypothetical protein
MRRRAFTASCALIVVLTCLAPAGSATPVLTRHPDSNVGRLEGTRAYVAVIFDGRRLRAYVCDGTITRTATISQWFESRWDGRSAITLVRNGIELEVEPVHDGRVAGRITAFSGPHRFSVSAATEPAGLYEGTGTDRSGRSAARVTWIVLPDGSRRGTFIPTRPPKCRAVLVAGPNGTTQWVSVCG